VFSTFAGVEPHFNMAKGVHMKFRSHFNENRPIPPATRSVPHAFTCSSGEIAETFTESGANCWKPSSARLKQFSALALPPPAMSLLVQSPGGALDGK